MSGDCSPLASNACALPGESPRMSREDVQTVVDDINESMAEIDKIVEVTTEKMADVAPGLNLARVIGRHSLNPALRI